jgi:predicted lipase
MEIKVRWLFDEINKPAGYKKIGDCSYKLIKSPDCVIVCFPGTGSLKNWFWNFTRLIIPYRQMPKTFFVHAGFFKLYKDVQKELKKEIDIFNPKRIIFTGYSQGGAIATIAHEDYEFMGYKPETITFASPRVFSWGVPKSRFQNLYRIYVKGDIVSKLPFFKMKHVGKNISIGKGTGIIPSVKKHYPETYRKYLYGLIISLHKSTAAAK